MKGRKLTEKLNFVQQFMLWFVVYTLIVISWMEASKNMILEATASLILVFLIMLFIQILRICMTIESGKVIVRNIEVQ